MNRRRKIKIDTSRESIETVAEVLKQSDWIHVRVAADYLLALLKERDALLAERNAS